MLTGDCCTGSAMLIPSINGQELHRGLAHHLWQPYGNDMSRQRLADCEHGGSAHDSRHAGHLMHGQTKVEQVTFSLSAWFVALQLVQLC